MWPEVRMAGEEFAFGEHEEARALLTQELTRFMASNQLRDGLRELMRVRRDKLPGGSFASVSPQAAYEELPEG